MTNAKETVALLIKAGKSEVWVKPKDKKTFSLEELQSFVGGNFEFIKCFGGKIMVLNEEGKLKGLPLNKKATKIAGGEVVGDVLLTDKRLIK